MLVPLLELVLLPLNAANHFSTSVSEMVDHFELEGLALSLEILLRAVGSPKIGGN